MYAIGLATGILAVSVARRRRKFKEARESNAENSNNAENPKTKKEIYQLRKSHFCGAQSISYENSNPLLMVHAKGAYMYDETETGYLDTRNNVCHVGHTHQRVVDAVSKQVSTLNTNSRYLHPNITNLADRLLNKMPDELCVVFFVNSGSEANDLAMRLATTHTNQKEMIVVKRAYHGHTKSVLEISPYKYDHKGGVGKASHVHEVPCPDVYRGPYSGPDAARLYSDCVKDACATASKGEKVAAFFIESGMSVAGVVLPPDGYLKSCYKHVRDAGGVCVADEVQVGFGRFGKHFWGFEQQGVVPDIVTMGKPFGNGMPLAAVVTTRAISDSFHNGLEYFNTFGGNPVCCAAGLAVLGVIEDEGLQEHATVTGGLLMARAREIADTPHGRLIGDVRGSGLFIGIEFVRNRVTKEPATSEASVICSRLKDEFHILTSLDGEFDNVMVIKPPMCFNRENVATFMGALEVVLQTLGEIDPEAERTPT